VLSNFRLNACHLYVSRLHEPPENQTFSPAPIQRSKTLRVFYKENTWFRTLEQAPIMNQILPLDVDIMAMCS
jgi:hypothetical protein